MEKEVKTALENMVRVGTVTDVDKAKRRTRVKFLDTGITSGWLTVVQHPGAEVYIQPDGAHSHSIQDTYSGGGSASEQPDHDHTPGSRVTYWMPKVNDIVLTLYVPVFNGDGYVLGQL